MRNSKISEKVRTLCNRLKTWVKVFPTKSPDAKEGIAEKKSKLTCEAAHSIAYQIIGDKIIRFLPLFRDLETNLHKSGVKVNFKAYVSLTILTSILASFTLLVLASCLMFLIFNISLFASILFGVGGSLFALAFSIVGFYIYPIYRADKLKRELEDELPFTTSYLAILTGAGVSPERIFHFLSALSVPLAVSAEAEDIVRDVNLFGQDIISALEQTSKRTSSERFRELLEGYISTIHSGSNSTAYLQEKSRQYIKLKKISLRKFSDTLSVLSEFYVALLLTGPLLLVIMLAVMAMLGGGDLGLLNPSLLLSLLTYLGLPLGALMFLIILDAVTPKW